LEKALQQRLLGAAILVALLVILVPEWLDGSGYRSRYPGHVEIPETPEFKPMPQVESPVIAPAPQAVTDAPVETSAPAAIEPARKTDTSVQAWALQMGSFSDRKNAMSLRDSLRGKGYAAYVEEIKSAGSAQFRVRIGPELDRARLEAMQKKLGDQDKLNGVVVKHP